MRKEERRYLGDCSILKIVFGTLYRHPFPTMLPVSDPNSLAASIIADIRWMSC
jgi:hypothetical protein